MVAEAANGREAIESFREHKPDVTLMDLRLPDISGIAAVSTKAESCGWFEAVAERSCGTAVDGWWSAQR